MNINNEEYKPKSKILAILFNICFPGLGYFYIGYFKKSLFFMIGLIVFVYGTYYLTDFLKNAYIFLSLFPIILFIYIYTTVDIVKLISNKQDKNYKLSKWYFMPFLIVLISLILNFIIANNPIRYFTIPASSMFPTIYKGDHIIVKEDIRNINRGEIVVFRYPKNPNIFYIKRCVAVGGDKIFIKNKTLYLQPFEGEKYIKDNYPVDNIVTINNSLWIRDPYKYAIKTIKNDEKIIDDGRYPSQFFNFNQIEIPKDSYFVMGDNREHSNDSRFWGNIKTKDIFGVFNGVICFNYKDLSRINLKVK